MNMPELSSTEIEELSGTETPELSSIEMPQSLYPLLWHLDAAEQHIAEYFSTARLLQMKVWWDTFPHEATPKLTQTYQWTNNITIQASQGNTIFTPPPHGFEELLFEAVKLIQLASVVEVLSGTENFELSGTETPEVSSTITEELSSTETPEMSSTITEELSTTETPEVSSTITEELSSTETEPSPF